MAKQSGLVWAVVLLVAVLVLAGDFAIPDLDLGDIFGGGNGLVDVSKQLKFHFTDEYTGGPIASKTDKFNLYDSNGQTVIEQNLDTDANGLSTTGSDYASGKTLYMRYEDSNDKQWWKFTVPQMNKADAESATYNLVKLKSFLIGTYTTDSLKYANGTAISDAGTITSSVDGDEVTVTYGLANTGNDNTGLKTSKDPLYGQNWDVELYITFSGTDYEKLICYDMDWSWTLGTTHYEGKVLNAYTLTKHKVAQSYKSLGILDTTFWLDLSGLTGSASVTMQITVKAYADHNYAQQHGGSFGPESVELAEHTVTIVD